MKPESENIIYTIGHSTLPINLFTDLLESFNIEELVDIRRFPSSKHSPQFNKDVLEASLKTNGIQYAHIEELGGRRKAQPGSKNNKWIHASFRGYADYMETSDFETGIQLLEKIAQKRITAYMCSETVWWSCHRALVSDYLKARGWRVLHIMANGKTVEHPYTKPARIVNGHVFYYDADLFNQ